MYLECKQQWEFWEIAFVSWILHWLPCGPVVNSSLKCKAFSSHVFNCLVGGTLTLFFCVGTLQWHYAVNVYAGIHSEEWDKSVASGFWEHFLCLPPQSWLFGSLSARALCKWRDKVLWRLMIWRSVTHFNGLWTCLWKVGEDGGELLLW